MEKKCIDGENRKLFINELQSAIDTEKVLTDDFILSSYTKDYTCHYCYSYTRPSVVVLPHSTEDVQKIVFVANKYKIPIVPLGGATSFWGATDSQGGIIIDLSNMDKVIKIDTQNLTFTVQAGVNVRSMNRELKKIGYCYPTYPVGFGPFTFGSEVAKNTGEAVGSMYGHVAKRLIALEVVLGNGDVLVTGSTRVIKNLPLFQQSGMPDLTHLFVASEGAYGIITEVTMGMQMAPVAHLGVDIKFEGTLDGFRAAVDACHELRTRKGLVCNGHLMDCYMSLLQRGITVKGIDKAETEAAIKEYGQTLVIEIESFVSQDECSLKKGAVLNICKKFGGEYIGDEGAKMLEAIEEENCRVLKTMVGDGKLEIGQYFTCNVSYEHMARYYENLLELLDYVGWPREKIFYLACIGDESCTASIAPWRSYADKSDQEKWKELGCKIPELATSIGVIPYRCGRVWRPYILDKLDPRYLKYIRTLKNQFDPNNIMNPGVSVFEQECQ